MSQQQPIVVVQGTPVHNNAANNTSYNQRTASGALGASEDSKMMRQQPYTYTNQQQHVVVGQNKANIYDDPQTLKNDNGMMTPYTSGISNGDHGDENDWSKKLQSGGQQGLQSQKKFQDVFFGILFYAHLALMAFLSITHGRSIYGDYVDNGGGGGNRRLQEGDYDVEMPDVNPAGVGTVLAISGVVGIIVSGMALSFMTACASNLIKFCLIINIVLYGLMGLAGLLTGAIPMAIMGFLFMGIAWWYAAKVWSRIPFAAANMVTAITAIRNNLGLTIYGFMSLFAMFAWSIWWMTAALGVIYDANENGGGGAEGEEVGVNGIVMFLLFVSYYWTFQVIKNVVHVTVAGTVGTWWFHPKEASSFCSRAVTDSFCRATTYSFGSICFGSLIVAIIEATREMVRQARESNDGIMVCLADCCLGCIEGLVEYFNQWAFVYVGLYGFSFMEAGQNVMGLFRARGWTSIITDNLIENVLSMMSLGVGVLAGLVVTAILYVPIIQEGLLGDDLKEAGGLSMAFLIALIVGFVLCSVLMGVISSAVNTVIVLYAEAPSEFDVNYPTLSNEMRVSWRQAWPVQFKY